MKTEVTRTVVTLVEVHTRETGDATVKGVSKVSDDSTLSRKVWINGEEVYAEQYPTRCIDKFAQPELQAFVEMLSKYKVPRKRSVYLSTGFYKTLCIILACIWLVTLLFFLYGFNAFVMLLNVHVASHLPERFRAAVQFDGRSREITTEKQYLLVTPRFINDLDINWHATPYVPTWRDIRANDWVVAYKKKD